MAYKERITSKTPTAILFLIDQSASMGEQMPSVNKSKADIVADVLNKTLDTLVTRCTDFEEVKKYFDIGVLTYSGDNDVKTGFQWDDSSVFHSVEEVFNHSSIVPRLIKEYDGGGKMIEVSTNFQIWFTPEANGRTPMRKAFEFAYEELSKWCERHQECFPPTVINISDGESTDGSPEDLAENLKKLGTKDGQLLLFNLHICTGQKDAISYPATDANLPDANAKMLFRMSSPLPGILIERAQVEKLPVTTGSRGFVYNADVADIIPFMEIGTIRDTESSPQDR